MGERRRVPQVLVVAVLGCLLLSAAAHGSRTLSSRPGRLRPPPIVPPHGSPFSPVRGDWEGRTGGFPISLEVGALERGRTVSFSLNQLVAEHLGACPGPSAGDAETLVESTAGTPVTPRGGLGLGKFGLDGRFTGARTLRVMLRYRAGRCREKLAWTLAPASRRPVADGRWRLSFSGGGTESFRVLGGGRLLAGLALPAALARCHGTSGTVGAFVGSSGLAVSRGRHFRLALRFAKRTATGRIDIVGAGCASETISLTARRA